MTAAQPYDQAFYAEGREHAVTSARRMVPRILELVPARSVVDVGCGVGTWLSVFGAHGVSDIVGVDGTYVSGQLEIPAEQFIPRDLEQRLTLDRGFELAMSLEVAEHLPATVASTFVASLCDLAPVVMFSAAVPSQGGVLHVNEQWPDYWAALFAEHGYECHDVLRREFWTDPEVSWWYAQNICMYATPAARARYPRLRRPGPPPSLAHPTLVERNLHRSRLQDALLQLLQQVPDGAQVLVADGGQLQASGPQVARHFSWRPFLERDGEYWGAPEDSAMAIGELERLRAGGANQFALFWPAFWWLDHYRDFTRYLEGRCGRVYNSPELVIYDLTTRL